MAIEKIIESGILGYTITVIGAIVTALLISYFHNESNFDTLGVSNKYKVLKIVNEFIKFMVTISIISFIIVYYIFLFIIIFSYKPINGYMFMIHATASSLIISLLVWSTRLIIKQYKTILNKNQYLKPIQNISNIVILFIIVITLGSMTIININNAFFISEDFTGLFLIEKSEPYYLLYTITGVFLIFMFSQYYKLFKYNYKLNKTYYNNDAINHLNTINEKLFLKKECAQYNIFSMISEYSSEVLLVYNNIVRVDILKIHRTADIGFENNKLSKLLQHIWNRFKIIEGSFKGFRISIFISMFIIFLLLYQVQDNIFSSIFVILANLMQFFYWFKLNKLTKDDSIFITIFDFNKCIVLWTILFYIYN